MSDTPTPPGWYPDVERAGGERWWDGIAWTEHRRVAPGAPASAPGAPGDAVPVSEPGAAAPVWGSAPAAPQGYVPYAGAATAYGQQSRAGWALGLSIFGFFCCAITSVIGLIMGRNEMKAIDEGRVDPAQRGLAQAAFVVGIVAVALAVGMLVLAAIGAVVGPQ